MVDGRNVMDDVNEVLQRMKAFTEVSLVFQPRKEWKFCTSQWIEKC